jgi:hypothetical protein
MKMLPPNTYNSMSHKYQEDTVAIIATVRVRLHDEGCRVGYGWEIHRLRHFLDEHTAIREAIAEAIEE